MKGRSTAICTDCGCKTAYTVKSQLDELTVRDITFTYVEHIAYCEQCGQRVYVPEISDENAQSREDAYRKAAKLITVSEINEILEKYSIGAGPLAKILGFGDVTINRYIAGQLPSKSHSEKLLEIRASHKKMEEYLESNKELISPVAYNKCRTALDQLNNIYGDSKIEIVARYMLSKSVEITPLALQKMLYYAQAFFQALFKRPLFTDACQAWAHGPVYPDVYYKYRDFGYDPIKLPELEFNDDVSGLSISEINLLDAIIAAFGRYSGTTLRWMTHNEQPWLKTRGSLHPTDRCVTVISNDLINSYFDTIVQEYNIINPCDIARYSEDMAKRQYC
jgi:putative zinc finger/helix-turn-helix YgiT family protein